MASEEHIEVRCFNWDLQKFQDAWSIETYFTGRMCYTVSLVSKPSGVVIEIYSILPIDIHKAKGHFRDLGFGSCTQY